MTTVTMEVEKRQGVKIRVKAQWATEDKMRDTLKLSAFLDPFFVYVSYTQLLVCFRDGIWGGTIILPKVPIHPREPGKHLHYTMLFMGL